MDWLGYGLLAAIFYGISTVLTKVAVNKNYFGLAPKTGLVFLALGIAITSLVYLFSKGKILIPKEKTGLIIAVFSGISWGVGSVMVMKAFERGAEASKLTPIFNTNTLVALILAVLFLGELPTASESLRVISGALLITFGAMLLAVG